MNGQELAEFSALGKLNRKLDVRQVAALCAGLEDLTGAAKGLRQDQALGDVLGTRLFAVDVLAGVGRQHRGRGVPVRTRGDQHGVDILAGQELTEVAVSGTLRVAVSAVDRSLDRLPPHFLDIANGRKAHVGLFQEAPQVVAAAVADADATDHDLFARRHSPVFAQHFAGQEGRQGHKARGLGHRRQESPPR